MVYNPPSECQRSAETESGMTSLMETRRRLRRITLKKTSPDVQEPFRRERKQHAARLGMWILSALTAWLLSWFVYLWLFDPTWLRLLPPLLHELMYMVETAGLLTLAFVWAGLGFRAWWREQKAVEPVSAEALYESLSPNEFERYVATLFRQKGYQVAVRGRSGDHGVDLEVVNAVGRRAVVQCKRYQNTVGEEVVRELMGTMLHERVTHGFLVTTAEISEAARAWAADKPITLIDGRTLAAIATSVQRGQFAAERSG